MGDQMNDPLAHATASMLEAWNSPERIAERKIAHALQRAADDMAVRVDIHTSALLVEVNGRCYAVTIQPYKTERERMEEEANRIRFMQIVATMPLPSMLPPKD